MDIVGSKAPVGRFQSYYLLIYQSLGQPVPQLILVIVVGRLLVAGSAALLAWIRLKWRIDFNSAEQVQVGHEGRLYCLIPENNAEIGLEYCAV